MYYNSELWIMIHFGKSSLEYLTVLNLKVMIACLHECCKGLARWEISC